MKSIHFKTYFIFLDILTLSRHNHTDNDQGWVQVFYSSVAFTTVVVLGPLHCEYTFSSWHMCQKSRKARTTVLGPSILVAVGRIVVLRRIKNPISVGRTFFYRQSKASALQEGHQYKQNVYIKVLFQGFVEQPKKGGAKPHEQHL